jgi:hypothetical protein
MTLPVEYRCPTDGNLFFKAEGPIGVKVEVKCRKCREYVVPVAKTGPVFLRTCVCSGCKRTQTVTTPVDEPGFCMVCGTPTLVITEEIRPPVEAPERVGVVR